MKTEKKEKIFKAALNMIRKTGVHSLAMGQLSKDSGIAAGTFYHYFTSKDMMLQETFLYCHKRAAQVGAKAIKGDDLFKNRFVALVTAWYEHFTKQYTEMYFIQESEAGYSVTNNSIRESRVFYNEVFHFLNQGIEKGTLRNLDPKLMLQIIYQNIFSVIKYEIIFETKFPVEELSQIFEICWHGLKFRDKKTQVKESQ
ncbi:MAG: TetR/AcrR family transcriptional regulator [Bacteroidetes bacterium]|nr:TetR/AcrR family transcriptional regulator [Bacteroidota bacterium]